MKIPKQGLTFALVIGGIVRVGIISRSFTFAFAFNLGYQLRIIQLEKKSKLMAKQALSFVFGIVGIVRVGISFTFATFAFCL